MRRDAMRCGQVPHARGRSTDANGDPFCFCFPRFGPPPGPPKAPTYTLLTDPSGFSAEAQAVGRLGWYQFVPCGRGAADIDAARRTRVLGPAECGGGAAFNSFVCAPSPVGPHE